MTRYASRIKTIRLAAALAAATIAADANAASTSVSDISLKTSEHVSETNGSAILSRDQKARRISAAVIEAVETVATGADDDRDALESAERIVGSAAKAAPAFADVIADAALSVPRIAATRNASGRVRMAAFSAATDGIGQPTGTGPKATITTGEESHTQRISSSDAITATSRSPRSSAITATETAPMSSAMALTQGEPAQDQTSRFTLTGTASARYDDNVYLAESDETGVTIFTLSPGFSFESGPRSASRFSLGYQQAFVRYEGEPIPDVTLGSGEAEFVYDGAKMNLSGRASFDQLNENTSATAGLGTQLYKRDLFAVALNADSPLTAKTALLAGATFDQTRYKNSGLVGTRSFGIPVSILYETTPKSRIGLGATFRNVDPQGGGPSSRDWYYNLRATGDFTAKLSGSVSAGYRTRRISGTSLNNIWGFDGSLSYASSVKTRLALNLSRDFGTGALGESTVADQYSLSFTADPTLQWSFRAVLAYTVSDYGPAVFVTSPYAVSRKDDYWAGSISASYLIKSWLSLFADFTHRTSDSTNSSANYSNNQLSLSVGVSY